VQAEDEDNEGNEDGGYYYGYGRLIVSTGPRLSTSQLLPT